MTGTAWRPDPERRARRSTVIGAVVVLALSVAVIAYALAIAFGAVSR